MGKVRFESDVLSPRYREGLKVQNSYADLETIVAKDYDVQLPKRTASEFRNSLLYQRLAEPMLDQAGQRAEGASPPPGVSGLPQHQIDAITSAMQRQASTPGAPATAATSPATAPAGGQGVPAPTGWGGHSYEHPATNTRFPTSCLCGSCLGGRS